MVAHPMHLHGHKFFLLGVGEGIYNESKHHRLLNFYNPVLRSVSVFTIPNVQRYGKTLNKCERQKV
jgi:hypothetical protein